MKSGSLHILLILLYATILHGLSSIVNINERKSDLYFANGILTSEDEASGHAMRLYTAILDEIYLGKESEYLALHNNDTDKIYVAYNYSFKKDFGETAGAVLDIMESYEQLQNTSVGWRIFNLVLEYGLARYLRIPSLATSAGTTKSLKDYLLDEGVPEYLADFLEDEIGKDNYDKLVRINQAVLGGLIDFHHDLDLDEQVHAYKNTIRLGRSAIVVAHSQGNLFTIEAYDSIEPWMQQYFYHVSVASPATTFAGRRHWLATFHNDPIKNIPGCVGWNIPNHIVYTGSRTALGEFITDEPKEFHGFNYYMGEVVTIDGIEYQIDTAKTKIVESVRYARNDHFNIPSQWQKTYDIGCPESCDHRIGVSHKFDSSLDVNMSGIDVLPFDETGKLYPLDNGTYVKADPEGKRVKALGSGPVCHELQNEENTTIDTIARGQSAPEPHGGAVEVTLSWGESGNDFDLDLDMPSSVRDVQSCMMEHEYVASEFEIYPGHYAVNVGYAGGAFLNDTLYITIQVPGETQVLKFDTNGTGTNPGRVATIGKNRVR